MRHFLRGQRSPKTQKSLFWTSLFTLCLMPTSESKVKSQMKMLVSSTTLLSKHFKPGVASENLPPAIYYNKYIPLMFQLKVPEWSIYSLKLNSTLHCTSDTAKSNSDCPVAFHLERLLSPLADLMRFSKNTYTPTEGSPYFGKFTCEVIEPHFFHLSAGLDELHLYTDKLKENCPLAKGLEPITKNLSNAASFHVTQAYNKFNSYKLTDSSYNNDYKVAHMAGFVGLQAMHILTKYIDTLRWTTAFSSCQQSRLHIGLIHSFMLQTALSPIKKVAEENGYKFSIPVHKFLPQYYKLPLTDCILGTQSSKKTNLMLRILVPVQKKHTKYQRIRLTKIPYLISEGDQKKICEIDSFDPRDDFLIEQTLDELDQTDQNSAPVITIAPECDENELCHVAEQPRQLVVDPCVKGLINNSMATVRDCCSFECFAVENEEVLLPIIIRADSNQFSITGGSKDKPISVFCNGKFAQVLEPNKTSGVMQVILPCDCEIRFKSEVYKSSKPCDSEGQLQAHYLSSVPFKMVFPPVHSTTHSSEESEDHHKKEEKDEIPEQQVPANWVLPVEYEVKKEEFKDATSHSGQLAIIWVLIVMLILANVLLLYVAYYNRLIHVDMIREVFPRWGVGTASPPRSRLEEEGQQQEQDNNQWPAGLNRL